VSGVAGIIHFDGQPVTPGQIEAMTASMPYRGPDGINHWRKANVALGQCMLRTTPESLEETQPLTNEDASLVLVMDGRVDNWEELRKELLAKGATLRTRADAELVLRAYEVWDADCLPHIDGDFAFVIWDARRQTLFCARDPLGNKPLFYSRTQNTIALSSEVKPLLEIPWLTCSINERKLFELLTDKWESRSETLWNGIVRLDAAHSLVVNAAGAKLARYWHPTLLQSRAYRSDQDYADEYLALLQDEVRRLGRSHRPVAFEVSGGLDSSAIFSVANALQRTGRLPSPALLGYTLRFSPGCAADEIRFARAVGAFWNTSITEVTPTNKPPQWYVDEARRVRDFPGYPNGIMHRGIYKTAVANGARVLMTGVGGDHWLQGTRSYYTEEVISGRWRDLWRCFVADLRAYGPWQSAAWFLQFGLASQLPDTVKVVLRKAFRGTQSARAREDYFWLSKRVKRFRAVVEQTPPNDDTAAVRTAGQKGLLNALGYGFDVFATELSERMGSSCGLELRHPFRKQRIVQFALSAPERLRLRGDVNKFVHILAMQSLMPEEVLQRRDKADFAVVFRDSITQGREMITELSRTDVHEMLDAAGLDRLFNSFEHSPEEGWQSWVLWNAFGARCISGHAAEFACKRE
jgi:asparagine synthase (glutamine-hydrolysing)